MCGVLIHMVCAVRIRGIRVWCVNPFGVCCLCTQIFVCGVLIHSVCAVRIRVLLCGVLIHLVCAVRIRGFSCVVFYP